MRRAWQVFIAPGPDDAELPTEPSPWHTGREVRIPLEHWELVVDFGQKNVDSAEADAVRQMSWSREPDSVVRTSADGLRAASAFLERLKGAVLQADPLVPAATEQIPDEYENDEHARMLDAVRAVFLEALQTGQPFRAWVE